MGSSQVLRIAAGKCQTSTLWPSESTTARCTAFSSSRTFPGQRIFLERVKSRLREALHFLIELLRRNLQEVVREQRNIVAAIAQWRQMHLHHVHAVVEVFAEISPLHHLGQIAIGGADQADIDVDRWRCCRGARICALAARATISAAGRASSRRFHRGTACPDRRIPGGRVGSSTRR